jgi:hypothetical protein
MAQSSETINIRFVGDSMKGMLGVELHRVRNI